MAQADHLEDGLRLYTSYPFDTDEAYKKGLESIMAGVTLASDSPTESRDDIERRARVFYFTRVTGQSITVEQAREAERIRSVGRETNLLETGTSESSPSKEDQQENYVLTFAELQELIAAGQVDAIPNNKAIPDELNEAPPSISATPIRKKPWEVTTESTAD
ncbi:hypothetical protein APHAL10511_007293 [Amanita phalloides]|nr:hypothetical protein APHAL10511_007293 [Amanita phalloides]